MGINSLSLYFLESTLLVYVLYAFLRKYSQSTLCIVCISQNVLYQFMYCIYFLESTLSVYVCISQEVLHMMKTLFKSDPSTQLVMRTTFITHKLMQLNSMTSYKAKYYLFAHTFCIYFCCLSFSHWMLLMIPKFRYEFLICCFCNFSRVSVTGGCVGGSKTQVQEVLVLYSLPHFMSHNNIPQILLEDTAYDENTLQKRSQHPTCGEDNFHHP